MDRIEGWNFDAGDISPFLPGLASSWEDDLDGVLYELDEWLLDPINVHDAIEAVEGVLKRKHHDYGEDNLKTFGELGILVRAADKVARLKNLIDKTGEVKDENREDTWRDLAGYAIQALILMKSIKGTKQFDVFETRKNRLIRGICPDCGEGVLLRRSFWENRLICSNRCGFSTGDLYTMYLNYPEFNEMIEFIASQAPYAEQS